MLFDTFSWQPQLLISREPQFSQNENVSVLDTLALSSHTEVVLRCLFFDSMVPEGLDIQRNTDLVLPQKVLAIVSRS